MGNEMKLLVRSFSNVEPQKLRFWLLAGCFLVSLTYFSISKPFVIIMPTINSRLSSNLETMNADQFGHGQNLTQAMIRCNVSDLKSELCKKFDVFALEMNSTTTNDSVSEVQDVKNATERTIITPKSSSNDDSKLVENESAQSSLPEASLKAKKSLARDPNVESGQKLEHEHDATLVQNSTRTAFPSIPQSESYASLKGTQKVENVLQQSVEKRLEGDAPVAKSIPTVLPSVRQLAIQQSTPTRTPTVTKPLCNFSNRRADICEIKGDIRIHGKISTVHVASLHTNESYTVRPYPRKSDTTCMANVRQVSVTSSPPSINPNPKTCSVNHSIPALVFSDYGYTGNYFHDFTDVIVPLFLTARQYDGNVQFMVTDLRQWWVNKYLTVFQHLSKFPIIDFDNDDTIRCFPQVVVGLKAHNDLTIDTNLSPYSMVDFTSFMRNAYSLNRHTPDRPKGEKPRLLIIARGRTRKFVNLENIVRSAEKMGFEVVVAENGGRAKVAEFARIVNSCDVMMGVHGAGLTNSVFLPTNAVLIQIVPWGKLDWIASTYFGGPGRDMNLKYLEYNIGVNESTLVDQYRRDDPVITDPMSLHKLGFKAMGEVYLVKQNVRLDVRRFRKVLSKAMKLVRSR